jgi:hypothetical protein
MVMLLLPRLLPQEPTRRPQGTGGRAPLPVVHLQPLLLLLLLLLRLLQQQLQLLLLLLQQELLLLRRGQQ